MYNLTYTWNLKKLNSETESRIVVAREWGLREMGTKSPGIK